MKALLGMVSAVIGLGLAWLVFAGAAGGPPARRGNRSSPAPRPRAKRPSGPAGRWVDWAEVEGGIGNCFSDFWLLFGWIQKEFE